MKKGMILFFISACVFLLVFHVGSVLAESPPQKGGVLPPIDLPVPQDRVQRDYLGLTKEGSFKIPQIKARVVIIEIFSMY